MVVKSKQFRCNVCDKVIPGPGICPACEAEFDAPGYHADYREATPLPAKAPRTGVHIAGPVVAKLQFCERCGDLLCCLRAASGVDGATPPKGMVPFKFLPYSRGTLVQRWPGAQAIYLGGSKNQVNCQ